ncbi:triose-phosphate isomerase [bacterium]|nr:triose-phosphate isomerase [bacterium]
MRKQIVAGNWKMHMTPSEGAKLIADLIPLVQGAKCDVVVAPTFTGLDRASQALKGSGIGLGAQNVYWEAKGAFTGEIALGMLEDLGVKYVIVGHSERRQYFGETDETVNKRVKCVLAGGLTPIMCVGETLAQREAGKTADVVKTQVRGGLAGLTADQVAGMVIAYEPVWAIGTGKVATTQQAQEVHAIIRGLVAELYTQSVADQVRIQYGGSVKPDNAVELLAQADIDGALVGGAALKAHDFAAICNASK